MGRVARNLHIQRSIVNNSKMSATSFSYPKARRDDNKEVIHGIEVRIGEYLFNNLIVYLLLNQIREPYRWLENPDSDDTKQFVDAQNAITIPYLESCGHRSKIKQRFAKYNSI